MSHGDIEVNLGPKKSYCDVNGILAHSIVCILSSQAISFQIFLYALFPRFPWSTLLSFPWYFMLHDLTYLGADISTDDMTIPPQTSLNYEFFDCHDNTHPIPKNLSRHPINQPHSTHHSKPHFICNSKFPRFTTVLTLLPS